MLAPFADAPADRGLFVTAPESLTRRRAAPPRQGCR
jgi:hypothetical protein